jgi:hypothetical protein
VTTTAGKWRIGIAGIPAVFFIDDAMAQRVTSRRPKAESAAFFECRRYLAGAAFDLLAGR